MQTLTHKDLLRRLRSIEREIARERDVLVKLDLVQERIMLTGLLGDADAGAVGAAREA
ncbi:MAG: hypothetical protein AB7L84_16335 [Acidimicrobiia bacterium]